MSQFGLVKSFQIDDGELDGLSAQECFVLGYELAYVDSLLKADGIILQPIHVENRSRIAASCMDARRRYRIIWMNGDVSESWMLLEVDPRVW